MYVFFIHYKYSCSQAFSYCIVFSCRPTLSSWLWDVLCGTVCSLFNLGLDNMESRGFPFAFTKPSSWAGQLVAEVNTVCNLQPCACWGRCINRMWVSETVFIEDKYNGVSLMPIIVFSCLLVQSGVLLSIQYAIQLSKQHFPPDLL